MHVSQLLHALFVCPQVEVVETRLPERQSSGRFSKERSLPGIAHFLFR